MRLSIRSCQVIALLAAVAAEAGEAKAHGFKVGLVAPFTGPEAARGRDIRDGFLLAARERDGHPDQHSDGHLGRMDVYLLPVDGAGDMGDVLAEVKALISGEVVEFLLVAAATRPTATIVDVAGTAIVVDLNGAEDFDEAGAQGLAATFDRDYDRPLTQAAVLGYTAAWRIDRTIRAVNEDVSDRKALRAAFEEAGLK